MSNTTSFSNGEFLFTTLLGIPVWLYLEQGRKSPEHELIRPSVKGRESLRRKFGKVTQIMCLHKIRFSSDGRRNRGLSKAIIF